MGKKEIEFLSPAPRILDKKNWKKYLHNNVRQVENPRSEDKGEILS